MYPAGLESTQLMLGQNYLSKRRSCPSAPSLDEKQVVHPAGLGLTAQR